MKYTVIEAFVDLQDNNHVYRVGDVYPRPNHDVAYSRIVELATSANRNGKPLIVLSEDKNVKAVEKKVDEQIEKQTEEKAEELSFADKVKALGLSKTEINRKSTADLQEMAKELGVANYDEMSGNQIKKMLTEALED